MKIDYTQYYCKWHDETPEHRAEMIRHFSRLLGPHLPARRDLQVLDVGCGMGFALLTLQELGYREVAGVDIDSGQVAAACSLGSNVFLTEDTTSFLNEHSSAYDLILCLDVIEHIPVAQQLAFVHALAAALRTGGRLIVTVPNANAALGGRWRYNDWTHTSSFTEHSLDFLLVNGGFDAVRVLDADTRPAPPIPWFPIKGTRNWWLWQATRFFRRLEMIAEFGSEVGRSIPLSLNLLGIAMKR